VIQFFKTLIHNRKLLADFVRRDLRARYVGSSMGFFWSVIFPIINLFVYMFVFKIILNARWSDHQGGETVAVIMLMGIIVWSAFAESMSRCTNCLVDNSNLIQKVVFPSEVLPTYIVVSSLINMIISLPVVLLALLYLIYISPETDPTLLERARLAGDDGFHITWTLVFVPVLIFLQGCFTVGLGMFFATLNLFWRDTFHLMGVALTVWMFSTPIFYPALKVSMEGYGWMLLINPMHWLIDMYREVILNGHVPNGLDLGLLVLASMAAMSVGSLFFHRQKRRFPDLL